MTPRAYSILVDDAHLASTAAIAAKIGAKGMTIDRVVPEAGAIRATGDARKAAAVRKIAGVAAVEEERVCRLAPIDGRIPN
jgi:hypothetical protein